MSEKAVDALLEEYRQMRVEIIWLMESTDVNFRFAITTSIAIIGAAISLPQPELLYLLPTTMFLFSLGQVMKFSTSQIVGTYILRLERKLKEKFEKGEILMNWEGGAERELLVTLSAPPSLGKLVVVLLVSSVFVVTSYLAYLEFPATFWLHLLELIGIVAYYLYGARFSRRSKQLAYLDKD